MYMLTLNEQRVYLFHDGGPYHIETSPLISSATVETGFYIIVSSVMKGLKVTYPPEFSGQNFNSNF